MCHKTAERQKYLTPEQITEWGKEPVRHKRCEGRCEHCGMKVLPLSELIRDSWAGCDGVLTLQPDPFMEDVWDDPTPVWLCHGQYQSRADDI